MFTEFKNYQSLYPFAKSQGVTCDLYPLGDTI